MPTRPCKLRLLNIDLLCTSPTLPGRENVFVFDTRTKRRAKESGVFVRARVPHNLYPDQPGHEACAPPDEDGAANCAFLWLGKLGQNCLTNPLRVLRGSRLAVWLHYSSAIRPVLCYPELPELSTLWGARALADHVTGYGWAACGTILSESRVFSLLDRGATPTIVR